MDPQNVNVDQTKSMISKKNVIWLANPCKIIKMSMWINKAMPENVITDKKTDNDNKMLHFTCALRDPDIFNG